MNLAEIAKEYRAAADAIRVAQERLEVLADTDPGIADSEFTPDVVCDLVYAASLVPAELERFNDLHRPMVQHAARIIGEGIVRSAIAEGQREAVSHCRCEKCVTERSLGEVTIADALERSRRAEGG